MTELDDGLGVDMEAAVADAVKQITKRVLAGSPAFKAVAAAAAAEQVAEAVVQAPSLRLSEAFVAQAKEYAQLSDSLSQPAKTDHAKLYSKAVDTLTKTSIEIDALDPKEADASSSRYGSLKRDMACAANSAYLHELFFANCFDPNSELFQDSLAYMRLSRDWGDFDSWMKDFMGCAMAAREGWVVCGYSMYLKRHVNVVVDGNDHGALLGLLPVLVVDMHEHAYTRDFGVDKESYLRAMMGEIDWEVVEDRVKRIDAAKEAL